MPCVDRKCEMVGIYNRKSADRSPVVPKFPTRLARIPVAYAASMIRMQIAKQSGFVRRLRQAEDADWLFKVLWDREYLMLPGVTYAYNDRAAITGRRTLSAYHYQMVVYYLNRHRSWPRAYAYMIQMWLKKRHRFKVAFSRGNSVYNLRIF